MGLISTMLEVKKYDSSSQLQQELCLRLGGILTYTDPETHDGNDGALVDVVYAFSCPKKPCKVA